MPLRELMDDRLLDALLERSRDEAGGLRLTAHLGYEPNDRAGHGSGNSRNGRIAKTVQTGVGPVALQVPRASCASPSTAATIPSSSPSHKSLTWP